MKNMTFQVGNYVVHSSQGVCLVKDRVFNSFAMGGEKEYYVLAPLHDQRNTRYIPVDIAHKSLRNIMSKDEMMDCIKKLPGVNGEMNLSKNAKKMFIEQVNKSMEVLDKIKLMKTMHIIKEDCEKRGKSMTYADEMVAVGCATLYTTGVFCWSGWLDCSRGWSSALGD